MLKCKDCTIFPWGSLCLASDGRKPCPSDGDETICEHYSERRKIAKEKAEAELSRRIQASWIDFEAQKPIHGDSVLGIDTEGNIEVYQFDDDWPSCLIKYDGLIKVFNITHWTFLPRPPKGE